jgi:hypothetical protein
MLTARQLRWMVEAWWARSCRLEARLIEDFCNQNLDRMYYNLAGLYNITL